MHFHLCLEYLVLSFVTFLYLHICVCVVLHVMHLWQCCTDGMFLVVFYMACSRLKFYCFSSTQNFVFWSQYLIYGSHFPSFLLIVACRGCWRNHTLELSSGYDYPEGNFHWEPLVCRCYPHACLLNNMFCLMLGWPSPCMRLYSGYKAIWTYSSHRFGCSRAFYSSWNTSGGFFIYIYSYGVIKVHCLVSPFFLFGFGDVI